VSDIELKHKRLTEWIFPTDETPIEVEEVAKLVAKQLDEIINELNEFNFSKAWLIGKLLYKGIEACKPKNDKEFLVTVAVHSIYPISYYTLKQHLRFYRVGVKISPCEEWNKIPWSVRYKICISRGTVEEKKELLKLCYRNNWDISELCEFLRSKGKVVGFKPPKCFVCNEQLDWADKGKTWGYVGICYPCREELKVVEEEDREEA